jgi:NAD-dependent dihydropyrimidine dehydrogenase PreA subunit
MAAIVDVEKCNACKSCEEACPNGSIAVADKTAVVNKDDCIDCAACVDACPEKAITMSS